MSLANTVDQLRNVIEKLRKNSMIAGHSVTLLAASKTQPASVIKEAIAAGITDFGENRVQEAQDKWPELRALYPQLRLHLIGPLQTNKVKQAVELFDFIQTVDRIKLAEGLADEMRKTGKRLPCYLQVNIGEEAQKAGVMPHALAELVAGCRLLDLPVVGLMCIPPHGHPPSPYFALLRELGLRHGLSELSMGMSEDYEYAVRMGSTCIRLGRALFGERL